MFSKTTDPRALIDLIYNHKHDVYKFAKKRLKNPYTFPTGNRRANSASITGKDMGDSGKGTGTFVISTQFSKNNIKVVSARYAGGPNAGHEMQFPDKGKITLAQVPIAALIPKATAVCMRGMLLHPEDLVREIDRIFKMFGKIPGNILIDENVTLSLDTERALEAVYDSLSPNTILSTKRGIRTAASFKIMKIAPTMRDLIGNNWKERFTTHYRLVNKIAEGFKTDLKTVKVSQLDNPQGVLVGSEKQFLQKLENVREKIKKYVSSEVYNLLKETWKNEKIAFTFEGAQAMGLHPEWGIDPTSTDPSTYGILTSSEGIIDPHSIAANIAIFKGPWMSNTGRRKFPGGTIKGKVAQNIRDTFNEYGRTDPVPRDVFPLQIPLYQFACKVDKPDYLYLTHMDAQLDHIQIATVYKNKKTKDLSEYRPYQWYLDKLNAEIIKVPGWKAENITNIKKPEDLPENLLRLTEFYSLALNTPIGYVSVGPYENNVIDWFS
ncbi:MAG: hypothetical protein ACD_24C00471G0002 [uncultured bacterium]|uniref:Adenylosuccinate synthetase n=1 Tax=candidate division WWE3 bacterium RBG_16_37_10 TaxID=1802610 RepID=A0A1F4V400_UNCKA|nr:MAG: hypothetical protein ACD_24C00471G0002 [uncultured bacterium]OGC51927.1 MAG: hypothetical protein A2W32_01420 [candidate division WWE3 bacterium RBG_16_37_10]